MLLLKETVAAGTTWKQNFTTNGVTTNIDYTLTQKDVSLTVGSPSFTNVVTVKMVESYNWLGSTFTLATITWYFSKGVGIIKITTEYDPSTGLDSFNGTTDIQRYTIK